MRILAGMSQLFSSLVVQSAAAAPASVTEVPKTTPLGPLTVAASPSAEVLAQRLRASGFTGDVLTAPADIAKYCTDYGKVTSATPKVVVRPKTQKDVQLAVALAIREKVQIRTRSGGHGLEGQSLSNGGIVVSTEDLRLESGAKMEIVGDHVRVVPGAHIGELTDFLAKNGYRTRIVTADGYPGIGGALSAAGTGRGSHKYGCMVDQVMRLTAVSPTAKAIDVTSDRTDYTHFTGADGALADLMLGSFGQAGIITSAEFPIIKLKGELRKVREPVATLEILHQRIAEIIAKDDENLAGVWAYIVKNPQDSSKLLYLLTTLRDVTDGSGAPNDSLPDPGADPRIAPAWVSVIMPDFAKSQQFFDAHPDMLASMTTPGAAILVPQKKMRDHFTLNVWNKSPTGAEMMGVGIFDYLDKDKAGPLIDQFRKVRADSLVAQSGQQYLTEGVPRRSEDARAEWKRIVGEEHYNKVLAALDAADPHGVFERLPGLERNDVVPAAKAVTGKR